MWKASVEGSQSRESASIIPGHRIGRCVERHDRMSLAALMGIAAAACWVALGWLIANVPPSGPMAQAGFYALLFPALACTVTLLAWGLRLFARGEGVRPTPLAYLSHGMVFSSLILFALWLQSLRMLTLVNAVLLLALFGFMEMAVLLGRRGGDD